MTAIAIRRQFRLLASTRWPTTWRGMPSERPAPSHLANRRNGRCRRLRGVFQNPQGGVVNDERPSNDRTEASVLAPADRAGEVGPAIEEPVRWLFGVSVVISEPPLLKTAPRPQYVHRGNSAHDDRGRNGACRSRPAQAASHSASTSHQPPTAYCLLPLPTANRPAEQSYG